ncbi:MULTISPECIES: thioesterase family protein [Halomonas]|uniref:4-hydroxybenzoyl-CoA thioesterase n=1 Tax=Halomonas halophila TaxID=29573 RepID=A0ABQ0U497_9GAMM|nr:MULTISPECIES: thioesterase family protein [Halomonas]MDR5890734.1 thioesterase family protein [Halomonas salina]RAH38126.1 thioesterase [Halomonas sp. SL1]WJY05966.1 thioesterase family protein [Halomonas halophila]GEK73286.1 4-hydroxybenzoyl-CoA thioesterase [Halomonas halophila]
MALLETRVVPEWVDYNGHMNDAEYARVFSLGVEALMDAIGLDEAGRRRHGYTVYTLETHLCYRREAHEGQPLAVDVTVLDRDAKRLHVFFEMRDTEGTLLATSEQMLMGIDSEAGRPAPFPDPVEAAIGELPIAAADAWPDAAGRRIGLPAKR